MVSFYTTGASANATQPAHLQDKDLLRRCGPYPDGASQTQCTKTRRSRRSRRRFDHWRKSQRHEQAPDQDVARDGAPTQVACSTSASSQLPSGAQAVASATAEPIWNPIGAGASSPNWASCGMHKVIPSGSSDDVADEMPAVPAEERKEAVPDFDLMVDLGFCPCCIDLYACCVEFIDSMRPHPEGWFVPGGPGKVGIDCEVRSSVSESSLHRSNSFKTKSQLALRAAIQKHRQELELEHRRQIYPSAQCKSRGGSLARAAKGESGPPLRMHKTDEGGMEIATVDQYPDVWRVGDGKAKCKYCKAPSPRRQRRRAVAAERSSS